MAQHGLEAARRMLSAYAGNSEPWKPDHDTAMACRDLEDWLDFGNSIFEALSRVRRRHGASDPEIRKEIEGLYRDWLKPCQEAVNGIEMFEQRGYQVQGSEAFRRNCEEAKAFLHKERRATDLETRIGLRDITLCPEAAEQLTQILEDTDHSAPRLAYPPRSVPLADASILRRR
jgi:hypothetical protein